MKHYGYIALLSCHALSVYSLAYFVERITCKNESYVCSWGLTTMNPLIYASILVALITGFYLLKSNVTASLVTYPRIKNAGL